MICEYCKKEHNGFYGSGRFCNAKCARGYSTYNKRKEINDKVSKKLKGRKLSEEVIKKTRRYGKLTEETKIKISNSLKGKKKTYSNGTNIMPDEMKKNISVGVKKYNNENMPESMLDVSKRTVRKILSRLNISCSRCGWNEDVCDIHHINGKKIKNPNNHNNLCYLCPNCHRLANNGKIKKETLITLDVYIGDRWKDYYYKK
jgi:hypothetical protein